MECRKLRGPVRTAGRPRADDLVRCAEAPRPKGFLGVECARSPKKRRGLMTRRWISLFAGGCFATLSAAPALGNSTGAPTYGDCFPCHAMLPGGPFEDPTLLPTLDLPATVFLGQSLSLNLGAQRDGGAGTVFTGFALAI